MVVLSRYVLVLPVHDAQAVEKYLREQFENIQTNAEIEGVSNKAKRALQMLQAILSEEADHKHERLWISLRRIIRKPRKKKGPPKRVKPIFQFKGKWHKQVPKLESYRETDPISSKRWKDTNYEFVIQVAIKHRHLK